MTISLNSAKIEPYVIGGNRPGLKNITIIQKFSRYGYPHNKHPAITSLFLYENNNFLYQLLSKPTSKCITCNSFLKKNSRSLIPHSKRAGKVIIFLYQNGNLGEYFKTKSNQNILQNAPICFVFLNFLVGAGLRTIIVRVQL